MSWRIHSASRRIIMKQMTFLNIWLNSSNSAKNHRPGKLGDKRHVRANRHCSGAELRVCVCVFLGPDVAPPLLFSDDTQIMNRDTSKCDTAASCARLISQPMCCAAAALHARARAHTHAENQSGVSEARFKSLSASTTLSCSGGNVSVFSEQQWPRSVQGTTFSWTPGLHGLFRPPIFKSNLTALCFLKITLSPNPDPVSVSAETEVDQLYVLMTSCCRQNAVNNVHLLNFFSFFFFFPAPLKSFKTNLIWNIFRALKKKWFDLFKGFCFSSFVKTRQCLKMTVFIPPGQ